MIKIRVDICRKEKERWGILDSSGIWRVVTLQGIVSAMAIVESGDKVKLRCRRVDAVSTQMIRMIQTGGCISSSGNGRKSIKGSVTSR